MPKFIPGLELNRRYYVEILQPLMQQHFRGLKYSAALTGIGSDVLGFDTARSTDHNWGPRCLFFFPEREFEKTKADVDAMLRKKLPYSFLGFSTNFSKPNTNRYLVQPMEYKKSGPVNHGVQFHTIRGFYKYFLGFDPYNNPTIIDWLVLPQQALLEVTSGEVYYDGLKELEKMRRKFFYYPEDVWRYLIRVQWAKIASELQFQARSGEEGDELGSNIIADRAVLNIMRMCFLFERHYAPYTKWFGTAFLHLKAARVFTPLLLKILHSVTWRRRQELLGEAHRLLARMHNSLKITKPLPTKLTDYFGRGYLVLNAQPFIKETERSIKNKKLRNMKYPIGSIDQFVDHARINQENYVYLEFKNIIK